MDPAHTITSRSAYATRRSPPVMYSTPTARGASDGRPGAPPAEDKVGPRAWLQSKQTIVRARLQVKQTTLNAASSQANDSGRSK